ncbi:MAG TPA: amidohydrolase family protein [Chitinophagaceae bacterium]|nr:amidohydrolase family protein [Chitinophagaceae bacterium]HPH32527.1 amidohydrolase family protein [Chitinophagaceae bacterium]
MKKLFNLVMLMMAAVASFAQANVLPAPAQKGVMYVKNVTIHVGNGTVIENGVIVVRDGKIEKVGKDIVVPADATNVVDGQGKQVYPGLILPSSSLGLVEISSIRASNDAREIGDMNPNVRSIVAYNTDSKVINTLRSNGILAANIIPQGSFLAGSSSVVQLDAWNWQDASLKTDGGMHLYMPSLMARPSFGRRGGGGPGGPNPGAESDPVKEGLLQLENLKGFFREAKAYLAAPTHEEVNLKFESVKDLLAKKQKFYVHANTVKQMLVALDFVKEFGFDLVLVGASESWQIAPLLKQHNVSVILQQMHSLPTTTDDDVDQPYKSAAALQKAGVLFAISDDDSQTRGRNLAFNAGTAVAYGLDKEQAIAAITLNAAKLMGVADKTGSIEVGKDANFIISSGDILDMATSNVTDAFIQGRKVNLDDKQKQLNDRFEQKYELKQKKGF